MNKIKKAITLGALSLALAVSMLGWLPAQADGQNFVIWMEGNRGQHCPSTYIHPELGPGTLVLEIGGGSELTCVYALINPPRH